MTVALAASPDGKVGDPDPLLVLGDRLDGRLHFGLVGVRVGLGELEADDVLVIGC